MREEVEGFMPRRIGRRNSSRVKSLAAACRKAEAMSVIASDGKRYAAWKKGDAKWLTF